MTFLLNRIIAAHGGLERWKRFNTVEATIVTGGAFWGMKGLRQDADPREITVSLTEQKASVIPFGAANHRTAFTSGRIAIETTDGKVIAERLDPRTAFGGHGKTTHWDPLHRAYFNGYALWTYLTTPFLLTLPGVVIQEQEPWREENETWHRLRAYFPQHVATHSEAQDFYFGDDLLLRRHDYNVDVAGGFAALQRAYDYRETNGIRYPTKRRTFARGADDSAVEEPLMVSIDLSNVRFT
ncbi:hypothetical protein [Rhizobium sp. BK399]|uniref:hypothetical protein n=1 Tax=Rhizobium sp. BK399 TaxID=2587063 RepID=UPI00161EE19F|nr:hypothetical protein [Rhizobium sp. BK399]MBB3544604.1 hypothetical protein [Rhizobium sp. BK399]